MINIIGTIHHFREERHIHFIDCKNYCCLMKEIGKFRVAWGIFQMFHLEFLTFVKNNRDKCKQSRRHSRFMEPTLDKTLRNIWYIIKESLREIGAALKVAWTKCRVTFVRCGEICCDLSISVVQGTEVYRESEVRLLGY